MMYRVALAAALVAITTAPTLAAELGGNPNSNSQGSQVGVQSSQFTGNGAVIGGGTNGTGQTQSPGSRADTVQAIHAAEGQGRDK